MAIRPVALTDTEDKAIHKVVGLLLLATTLPARRSDS